MTSTARFGRSWWNPFAFTSLSYAFSLAPVPSTSRLSLGACIMSFGADDVVITEPVHVSEVMVIHPKPITFKSH